MNKLKKDLEETQKKLEESMTDKYLVKRVPMGKLPKSQVMKMKSHAKQDKIIQKIYEKITFLCFTYSTLAHSVFARICII